MDWRTILLPSEGHPRCGLTNGSWGALRAAAALSGGPPTRRSLTGAWAGHCPDVARVCPYAPTQNPGILAGRGNLSAAGPDYSV